MEVDKSNLREIILNSARQLSANLEFFNQLNLSRRSFNKVLFCGMGGSALVGDLFYYFKVKRLVSLALKVPVFVHRHYGLPPDTDAQTLVICVSHSGNTQETIDTYETARKSELEIAGLTAGGRLAELCQKNKTPWIKIPNQKIPPRYSLDYQLAGAVKILMGYGLLSQAAQYDLAALAERINPSDSENEAKFFCQKLTNKIPVIYASEENKVLARLWKIKFNENTKVPAFWNSFPELNHNEMTGWTNNFGPFYFLFLQDADDLPWIQKRMVLTAQVFKETGLPTDLIKLHGADPLEKLFWGLNFGDWLSYYLALFYGVDPAPVEMVEEFKKILNE